MTLKELETKLAEATEGSRELDADICVTLLGGEIVWKQANLTMENVPAHRYPSVNHLSGFANEYVPHYSSSLDAAIALCARVLPDWRLEISGVNAAWSASLNPTRWGERGETRFNHAANPALALCLAIVRALISKGGESE